MHFNEVSALKSSPFSTCSHPSVVVVYLAAKSRTLFNIVLFWVLNYSEKLQLLAHSDLDMPYPRSGSTSGFSQISTHLSLYFFLQNIYCVITHFQSNGFS
jgi:hypothetical protein